MISLLVRIAFFPSVAYAALREIFPGGSPGVSAMFNTICSGSIFCTEGATSGQVSIASLASVITRFIASLVGGVAVAMLVYAGIRLLSSQGSSEKAAEAKKIMMWALIGVVLAIIGPRVIGWLAFISLPSAVS